MAPPFASWASGSELETPDIWVKNKIIGREMGQNLSEDLFFCSSPDFGRKMGRNLSEDLFFLLFT